MKVKLTEQQLSRIVDFESTKDRERRNSVQNIPLNTSIKNAEDMGE